MRYNKRNINDLVSRFSRWVGSDGSAIVPKLSAAIRRAILQELPRRDQVVVVEERALVSEDDLRIIYSSATAGIYPTTDGKLVCRILAPDWNHGWSKISTNDAVSEIIGDYFHLARQYVARSRMVTIVGAIALVYDRACEFRYASEMRLRRFDTATNNRLPTYVGNWRLQDQDAYTPAVALPSGRRIREFAAWAKAINGLDPFVHRALFQYWRSIALTQHGFPEDAITALDSVISVVCQFLKNRLKLTSNVRRELSSILRLPKDDEKCLEALYQLRCSFGAHPGISKWWDVGEMYGEELEIHRMVVKRVLSRMIDLERCNRTVDPDPVRWSDWFVDNAGVVWDSVWFEHIR